MYEVEINGLILEFPRRPTEAEVEEAYYQVRPEELPEEKPKDRRDVDKPELTFDKLKNNEQFVKDLKDQYKADKGQDFDGNVEDLIENAFEDWNMTEFNLAKGAFDVAKFANMDEEEAQRTYRIFDVYDRTAATGAGSRSGWEQFKGVASALATDPTTYLSFGVGKAATTPAAKEGVKFAIKQALKRAARPASVGAGYAAAADMERQGQMMALGAQDEYDVGQTIKSATTGAILAPAIPGGIKLAAKGAVKTAQGVNKMFSKAPYKEVIEGGKRSFIETLGGQQVAKQGVLDEAIDVITTKEQPNFNAGEIANERISGIVNYALLQFQKRYEQLGTFKGLNKNSVTSIINRLREDKIDTPDLRRIFKAVESGTLKPSQAMRDLRSVVSSMANDARSGIGDYKYAKDLLGDYDSLIRRKFLEYAKQSDKAGTAARLDKDYSDFLKMTNEGEIAKFINSPRTAEKVLIDLVNNPKLAYTKLFNPKDGFLKKLEPIEKILQDKTIVAEQQQLIAAALSDKLFTNPKLLEKFILEGQGRAVLKKLYGVDSKTVKNWQTILQNASKQKGAATFWGRLFGNVTAIASGNAIGGRFGALGGMVGTVGGFLAMNKLLNSQKFQQTAMELYSKTTTDGTKLNMKAVDTMKKMLRMAGFSEDGANKFIDSATGVTDIGGAVATKVITGETAGE